MSEEDLKQEVPATEDPSVEVELEGAAEESSEPDRGTEESAKADESGDELESYSKNVQKRIKKLTEKYRQEERDREEAVRLAHALRQENETLKSQMQTSSQAHLNEYGARLDNQLNLAKQAYKQAHDIGDVDKMFEAQQALSKISIEQERYRLAKQRQDKLTVERQAEPQQQYVQQPQQQQVVQPDPKAQGWAEKNEWFGQDEVMTYAAFGIHRKLVEDEGFDPTSDEYYNEIDNRMRKEFPQRFGKNGRSGQVASADTSASRRPSGRRTVKLSPSQVAIAKKLGVPLEEYAKYVKD